MEIWLMAKKKNLSVWVSCPNIGSLPSEQESSECNVLGANENFGEPPPPQPPNFSNVTEGITKPIKRMSKYHIRKMLEILWLNKAKWLFSIHFWSTYILSFKKFITLVYTLCVVRLVHACQGNPLLSPSASPGSNSGHQIWWKHLYSPSYLAVPLHIFLNPGCIW